MNKKILVFFTFNYDLGTWQNSGILNRELKYYENLVKETNYEITFLTYGDKFDKKILPIKSNLKILNIFNKKKLFFPLNLIYSFFFIYKNKDLKKFDIFKTNQNYGSWLAVFAKIIYKKPLIARAGYDLFHFSLLKKNPFKIIVSYFVCFLIYRFSNIIFIPTTFYKNFISKCFFVDKRKIKILPNYIDLDNFKFKLRKTKFPLNFLYLGRIENQKNIKFIIDLFKNNQLYNIDIIGKGSKFIKFNKLVKKYDNIKLINEYFKNEEIADIFNKYNFFILPSKYEGCPKILLEAMCNGMICFVFNLPNLNELIFDQVNGFNLDNNINKTIEKINNIDNKIIEKISIAASSSVKQSFNLNRITLLEKGYIKQLIYKK